MPALPPKISKWLPFPPVDGVGGGVPAHAAPAGAPAISRFLNRDLSWLKFNDRVLAEAADPRVPALERLRFCTIVSSNLDEFFMVRVAEISRLARRYPLRRFPDGLTAAKALAQIREQVIGQKARQASVLEDIFAALEGEGIRIHADFQGHSRLDREMKARLPEIKYVLRKSSEPAPPSLMSERLHVYVRFPGEYAILTLQDREARLIELPRRGGHRRFALAERWLADRAEDFFPDREVIEAFPFKIIREADLRYRPDDEESLEDQIAEAVLGRSRAKVVRLEVDAPSYSEGALSLAASLGLDSGALYRFDLPLDLRTLANLYQVRGSKRLRYPPLRPQVPPPLADTRGLFEMVRKHDIILHHPYDSFDSVVTFLSRAARDPKVTRIYHTMYRTSRQSPIMESLKEAVRQGKKVTAYVEIKARFDELNNLRWAQDLRQAGVRVVQPMGGFKVHSKVTQIFRQEGESEVSYLHLGTGNYHPSTALQYTDLGLLTANPAISAEISAYFDALRRRDAHAGFKELLVAPRNLHSQTLRLIHEETRIQREGGRGHIMGKMNALVDTDIIEALYAASRAGVKIELQVRGICCLRPGIKSLSENIRVVSVVDRFLEHSRIYYFRAGGVDKVYLSSADWMPRNFYTRFEIAFPVKDTVLRHFVRDVILEGGLADTVKAWNLKPDGTYERVTPSRPGRTVRSQEMFQSLAENQYRGTILEYRIPL
ncbi:MAG: polyphosphate kinase 1 [Elusimicrobia bacterium]|nr:polyphosphate kinase 1 [Elusimicrobiota bacterium]